MNEVPARLNPQGLTAAKVIRRLVLSALLLVALTAPTEAQRRVGIRSHAIRALRSVRLSTSRRVASHRSTATVSAMAQPVTTGLRSRLVSTWCPSRCNSARTRLMSASGHGQ